MVVVSLPFVVYYICKAHYIERHGERYSEEERYKMARKCIRIMMRNGRIETESFGQLPEALRLYPPVSHHDSDALPCHLIALLLRIALPMPFYIMRLADIVDHERQ